MTIYHTFIDSLVGKGSTTIQGISTTGSEYGVGVSSDLYVSGVVTASSYYGDGSTLTGVIATGTGVVIRSFGNPIGTAATINFANNLNATLGSGIATITAVNYWDKTTSGINTLAKVGIGTTNPTSDLSVLGNILVSGVSTFSGRIVSQSINSSGVSTFGNTVVGGATTQLLVNGDARVTGILTIGTSSITLDGSNNRINVGSGVTIQSSGSTFSGIITATSFVGSGTLLSGIVTSLVAGNNITINQSQGQVSIGVSDYFRTVFDYGAVGDGTTDDSDAFQAAFDDASVSDILVPPGSYKITKTITNSLSGKKLFGPGPAAGIVNLKFYLASSTTPTGAPGKVGIWCKNKTRFYDLTFTGMDLTDDLNSSLIRFDKTVISGSSDEADMDSSVENCNFSGFRGTESNTGNCAVFYSGRNISVSGCSFSDDGNGGTCIILQFPTTTSAPDSLTNPNQGGFYGHRKARIYDNLFHLGQKARILHLTGDVTIRGLIFTDNMCDIGGQMLFCDGVGGICDSVISSNTFQMHTDLTEPQRDPLIYFKSGVIRDTIITHNSFAGGDNIDGVVSRNPPLNFENDSGTKRPLHVFRAGVAASITGLNLYGNIMRFVRNESVRIEGASQNVVIVGNTMVNSGISSNVSAIKFTAPVTRCIISNNMYTNSKQLPLVDFSSTSSSNVKVTNNVSNVTVGFTTNTGSLTGSNVLENT